MAFHMSVKLEKPVRHLSVDDWMDKIGRIRNVAMARRADGLAIRNSARQLLNEAKIEGFWSGYESQNAMTSRMEELEFWRGLIQTTFERLESKILNLQVEKRAAEEEMVTQLRSLDVLPKMLALRDDRYNSELTPDQAYLEMKKELHILEANQLLLKERCQSAWIKLQRLDAVRFKIEQELKNKKDTVDMDTRLLAMNKMSTDISYKMEPLRNPRSCCSYESWLEHTKNIKQLAENEMSDAVVVTDTLNMCYAKSRNILATQQARTRYCLRKRISQMQRAISELAWQQMRLTEDLQASNCGIEDMEAELETQKRVLMVAETRLETRAMRSITELCLDKPHRALCNEVEKLRAIQRFLLNKVDESKANFNLQSEHAKRLDLDLDKKRHTLQIDEKALEMHMAITEAFPKVCDASPQTDCNLTLVEMPIDSGK